MGQQVQDTCACVSKVEQAHVIGTEKAADKQYIAMATNASAAKVPVAVPHGAIAG